MPIIEVTPEVIEKNHWRYQKTIHKTTNERINKILKYGNFTAHDLATLLDVDLKTASRYMQDYTKMPLKKSWLLGQLLNVRLDCFPNMYWWHNITIDNFLRHDSNKKH